MKKQHRPAALLLALCRGCRRAGICRKVLKSVAEHKKEYGILVNEIRHLPARRKRR